MIRLLTAAAMVALLASPAMAQSVSPSDQPSGSSSTLQNQGTTTSPESSTPESMGTTPGLSGQAPADCLPNDPRPACQTAQLPNQESPSAVPGAPGSTTYPSERGSSGSLGGSGMGSPESGSPPSPGTTDR